MEPITKTEEKDKGHFDISLDKESDLFEYLCQFSPKVKSEFPAGIDNEFDLGQAIQLIRIEEGALKSLEALEGVITFFEGTEYAPKMKYYLATSYVELAVFQAKILLQENPNNLEKLARYSVEIFEDKSKCY
jgi:hypothetical protein